MIKPNDLDTLNSKNDFCAYKGSRNKNILFLGSCRLSPLMYYLNILDPTLNIFCIYVPFWDSNPDNIFPKSEIEKILPSTDIIVTESIHNNPILNTNRELSNNFFSEFSTDHLQEIRLPNYILSMYFYSVFQLVIKNDNFSFCEKDITQVKDIFYESKNRLSNSINKHGFSPVNNFLNDNFTKIKMFSTINHPTTIVSMLTFKIAAERLGINKNLLTFDFFKKISNHHFLSGNSTPITQMDIDTYGFKFKTKVFDNNIIKTKDFNYRPSIDEEEISEEQIKIILSSEYD